MFIHNHHSSLSWRSCGWEFGLLALLELSACGVPGQGIERATGAAALVAETPAGVSQATVPTAQPIAPISGTSAGNTQSSNSPPLPPSPSVQPTEQAKPTSTSPQHELPASTDTPTTVAAGALTAAALNTGTWQTYHSIQGGFQVDYPASWTASERSDASGTLTTTFAPPGGGAGVAVIVRPRSQEEDNSDIPNVHCGAVTIGGLSGKRCLDTIAFNISTTLAGQDTTYTITASTKRADQNIYQRLLESFVAAP